MRFDGFDEFKETKETVKDISYDESNNEYMSESELEAYNFDKVKENFRKKYDIKPPKSVDGLMLQEEDLIFLEFKNGNIDSKTKKDICDKIFSSVLVLLTILDEKVSDLKSKLKFILIYNKDKNGDIDIAINLSKDAKQPECKQFDLSGYGRLYFSQTDTFDQDKFNAFLTGYS
ncbi:hypothetical protein [uncultured Campylobacter sp.]|uniref:hypothetical protein n=1 Tax=uncultured Campylobacter sp. TaxID=218934 RepID=UPI003211C106